MEKKLLSKPNFILLIFSACLLTLSSCRDKEENGDEYFNQIIVGYWQLVSTENELGEIYEIPYAQNVIHFTEEGTYDNYHWDSYNKILSCPSTNYYFHWSYDSKKKELHLAGNECYSVLDFDSNTLTLKQDFSNGIFSICVYKKLSESEIDSLKDGIYPNGSGDNGSGSGNQSSSVPSSIVGKYIHLYRSDGQKLIVEHLTSNAPNFINNSWISYIPGFEPYYEYEKKNSNSARYYIHWNTLSYSQGSSGVNPKTYVEVTLNFDSSDRTHGTFSGTNWIEGWNVNTNTAYRKNETESKGIFYLGGATDPNPEYGTDNGGNSGSSDSGKEGRVKTIEISSVSDITSDSAVISGVIDIDGKYDEVGIICTSFDNSVEYYAYSLACAGPNTFKSGYGKYCTTISNPEFSVKKTGLLSNRNYSVEAYAIIGDKLYRSSSKSFKTN